MERGGAALDLEAMAAAMAPYEAAEPTTTTSSTQDSNPDIQG